MLNLKDICDDSKFPPTKVFFSRRNKVCLKESERNGEKIYLVVKEHPDEILASLEVKTLTSLYAKKVKVPYCYGHYKEKVVTEYLSGVLLNVLVDDFSDYGSDWIAELASWYFAFHSNNLNNEGQVLLKADNNLRNFIYHKGSFYGFDFEEPLYGHEEEDLGECCAYILTNSPAFTEEKYFIVKEFIKAYLKLNPLLNTNRVEEEIIRNLYILGERRPKQKDEILANIEAFGFNSYFTS